MKKLHKKISAMALACMVAAGGFAVSEVKAHAASYYVPKVSGRDIENLNKYNQDVYYDVKKIVEKYNGKIVKVLDYKFDHYLNSKMDRYIRDEFSKYRFVRKEFKYYNRLKSKLIPGLGCIGESVLEYHIKHHDGNIIRLNYLGLDFLIVFNY